MTVVSYLLNLYKFQAKDLLKEHAGLLLTRRCLGPYHKHTSRWQVPLDRELIMSRPMKALRNDPIDKQMLWSSPQLHLMDPTSWHPLVHRCQRLRQILGHMFLRCVTYTHARRR